jgi:3-deoxy-D-manno-octulosonic-acid transferase
MLSSLYQYATVAYIGGGFGKDGVHNVLEAAVYGKPVLHGPVYQKYAEAIGLVNVGGAMVVSDNTMLEKTLDNLFSNQAILSRSGKSAKDYVESQGGATQKILQFVQAKRLLTN